MSETEHVEQLWKAHLDAPFPRALAGAEIDGEDLALLDSMAAGCISTFVGSSRLDGQQLQVLTACAHDLSRVCPRIPAPHRAYFERLRDIAQGVVRICREGPD